MAAALGAGIWLYRTLFPGDERQIRTLLAQAAAAAEVKPNENPLIRLAGANRMAGFFSSDAVIQVDAAGMDNRTLRGREELVQAVAAARSTLQEARVQLREVTVQLDSGGQGAGAQLVAIAYLNGTGDPLVEELKLRLAKLDGHWKILRVETVRSLGI